MERALVLLLLLPLAGAISPDLLHIEVMLPADGPTRGMETYIFPEGSEENLSRIASEVGFRYSLWKARIEDLSVHGCKEEAAEDVSIVLKEINGLPAVVLTYTCPPPRTVSEDVFYKTLRYDYFTFPVVGGFMVLPQNATLVARLPQKSRVVGVSPIPTEEGEDFIEWIGPVNTATRFSVTYSVPKVYTAPSVSQIVYKMLTDPYVLFPLLAVAIILYSAREKVKEVIAGAVSSVTELEREKP